MIARKIIGLIPARSGSVRVPDKNIFEINGEPLICRAVRVALQSEIFSKIVVSTDSKIYSALVKQAFDNKVDVLLRPVELATSGSPDIEWVQHCATHYDFYLNYDAFAILRCTSPFRTALSIQECWQKLNSSGDAAHSIRAIEKVSKHPAKMWTKTGDFIHPLYPFQNDLVPWHSCQSNTLPVVFNQTASMEMAWVNTLTEFSSISGQNIIGFETPEIEAVDINTPLDLKIVSVIASELGL